LKDITHDAVFSKDDGILDKPYLKKIWDEHQRGTYDRSPHLWAILMFRQWGETFGAKVLS
jgi:hypothetical protein